VPVICETTNSAAHNSGEDVHVSHGLRRVVTFWTSLLHLINMLTYLLSYSMIFNNNDLGTEEIKTCFDDSTVKRVPDLMNTICLLI